MSAETVALTVRVAVALAIVGALVPVYAADGAPRMETREAVTGTGYRIESEETHTGDLYVLRGATVIEGTQDGDLYLLGSNLSIRGAVTGDVNALVREADLSGTFGDTVRVWAFGDVRFDGTVDGDLIVFGERIVLGPETRITGDLRAAGSRVEVRGTVLGGMRITGGDVVVSAQVRGNATVRCDSLDLEGGSRIAGDLDYEAKRPIPAEAQALVGGGIEYGELPVEEEERARLLETIAWRLALLAAALVTGIVGIGVFRAKVPTMVRSVGDDTIRSAGLGFITIVAVPFAALLVALLVVTLPLVLIVLGLYAACAYVAKLPVALWLGRRLLRWLGRSDPSPYVSLLLGLPILYVLFAVPFVGSVVWLACLFVGLGALILAARRSLPRTSAPE